MSKKILVVTSDYYAVRSIEKLLPDDVVQGCHRDYHLETMVASLKPDFILSDGTCKTRLVEIDDKPVFIFFNPKPFVKKLGIPVRSLQWFLFIEKLKKVFSRKTCAV